MDDDDGRVAAAALAHLTRLGYAYQEPDCSAGPMRTVTKTVSAPPPPSQRASPTGWPSHLLRVAKRHIQALVHFPRVDNMLPATASLVIMVIMVIMGASLVADRPKSTYPSEEKPSSISPTSSQPPTSASASQPVATSPATTNLVMAFAVDPIPGFRFGDSSIFGSAQTVEIREVTGDPQVATRKIAWVIVFGQGAFDPRVAQAGESDLALIDSCIFQCTSVTCRRTCAHVEVRMA
jgi:hypothetical protein